jgi:hypothetical protein
MDNERAYRAYLIGSDGVIINRVDLECEDDETAKARAELLVDGHDVELWDGARKIADFKTSKPKPWSRPRRN